MLKTNRQVVLENRPETVKNLYSRYAAMLLGYIYEIVKDRKLADELLVKLFCDLSDQCDQLDWDGANMWCQLQRFAKTRLAVFQENVAGCAEPETSGLTKLVPGSSYSKQLTGEQHKIFCDVYYHRKSIAEISRELNKTEDLIRKTLKEAFAIMRKGGEN